MFMWLYLLTLPQDRLVLCEVCKFLMFGPFLHRFLFYMGNSNALGLWSNLEFVSIGSAGGISGFTLNFFSFFGGVF